MIQQLQHRIKELETSMEAGETLHRDELNLALDKAEEERQRYVGGDCCKAHSCKHGMHVS